MGELWFYHLERTSLEEALPPLLEKCLARGWRALVRATSRDRLEALDERLWTWREESFLPHGLADGPHAARQPILLTLGDAIPNGAQAVFLLDGAQEPAGEGVERAMILFDGRDAEQLAAARERWKTQKAAGRPLSYWKQAEDGRWDKAH